MGAEDEGLACSQFPYFSGREFRSARMAHTLVEAESQTRNNVGRCVTCECRSGQSVLSPHDLNAFHISSHGGHDGHRHVHHPAKDDVHPAEVAMLRVQVVLGNAVSQVYAHIERDNV